MSVCTVCHSEPLDHHRRPHRHDNDTIHRDPWPVDPLMLSPDTSQQVWHDANTAFRLSRRPPRFDDVDRDHLYRDEYGRLRGSAHDVEQRMLGVLARLAAGIRADGSGSGSESDSGGEDNGVAAGEESASVGDGGDSAGAGGIGAVHGSDSDDVDEVVTVRSDGGGSFSDVREHDEDGNDAVTTVAMLSTTRPHGGPYHTAGVDGAVGVGAGAGAGAGTTGARHGSSISGTQHGQEFVATWPMEPTPRSACNVATPPPHGVDVELAAGGDECQDRLVCRRLLFD